MGYLQKFKSQLIPDRPILANIKVGRILISLLASEKALRPIEIARQWHDKHEASQLNKYYTKSCRGLVQRKFLSSTLAKKVTINATGRKISYYFYKLNYDRIVNEFSHYLSDHKPKSYNPLNGYGKNAFRHLLNSELCRKFMTKELKEKDSPKLVFNLIFWLVQVPKTRVKELTAKDIKLIKEARTSIEKASLNKKVYWNDLAD